FEQLCINYANEALQFYFNRHVFKLEQEEYVKEKLSWKRIEFMDNTDCLDLIGKKPNGIIPILDDESSFPRATDQSFLQKCHFAHVANPLYGKPRLLKSIFSIKHYAGEVEYNVRGFLDKNRDMLRSDVIDLFSSSKNTMLSLMYSDIRELYESHKGFNLKTGRFITMKAKTPTVSARFHDSLNHLLEIMTQCNPYFIRCIKPNNEKLANKLELSVVLEQLKYTGVLETITIRKLGYPRRYKFDYFAKRYRCLLNDHFLKIDLCHLHLHHHHHHHSVNGSSLENEAKEIMIRVLSGLPSKFASQYQIGVTKIFLRESLEQQLEQQRSILLNQAALIIQRTLKSYIDRNKFIRQRNAVIILQKSYRHWSQNFFYIMSASPVKRTKVERKTSLGTSIARAMISMSPDIDLYAWDEQHTDQQLYESTQSISRTIEHCSIPDDINNYPFMKYITSNTTCGTKWDRKLIPINEPFTVTTLNEQQYQLALVLFKLILRFINTSEYDKKRDRALGDYIVQLGLMNEILRDEIFVQICNQTWNNIDNVKLTKAWLLMLNAMSCFAPSPLLYKFLLKYVSDNATDESKPYCQQKLLFASE
ncbi:unnamed protein product, partial [Didymodactylos carnosus]